MRVRLATTVLGVVACASAVAPGCASDEPPAFGASVAAGSGGSAPIPLDQQIVPAPGGARRLVAAQYVASIRQVLGDAAAAVASPPDDIPLHGFAAIGATELALSAPDVERYEASARAVAAAVVAEQGRLASLMPCTPTGPNDAACLSAFVASVGRRLWRRPLLPSEVGGVAGVALKAGSVYGTVNKAAVYALTALLQSPDFLYLVEIGEPEGFEPGRRWLTPLELASRMSFFLNGTPPDDALLDAAEKGGLDSDDEIRGAAATLLARPAARSVLGAFYDEVFRFGLVGQTVKNAERYPEWTPELQGSIHESARLFLDDLVWNQNADARTMLTAGHAFVDSTLAPVYGLSVDPDAGMVKVALPEEQQRMGLLGSAAFLSVFSHALISSPTKRGVFIRRTLLCETVPPPPPNVVPKLPEDPNDGLTTKELLSQHMKQDDCKVCHALFDSLGWALEEFDAIGRHRTVDKGKPIDTSGESPNVGSFAGPTDLAQLLADDVRVPGCMVRNLYRGSMGHLETDGEEVAIDDLLRRFDDGGFRVRDLLLEIVASPAFRLVGEPK